MPLLEINNLALEFGRGSAAVRVVDGVSLRLEAGEVLCLVGESGSGKSVTALAIAHLSPAHVVAGEVLLAGRDVGKMSPGELRGIRGGVVSYVFQEPGAALNPVFRIGTLLRETIELHQPGADSNAEALRLLKLVGIPDPVERLRSYPHELSGGMQQRVVIALALAARPKLLVADEPTTALDTTIQAQIIELLMKLKQELGMAILLITHNLGLVGDIADRVAVLYAGRMVETAPTRELLLRPQHPYTQALLRAVPRLGADGERLRVIPGQVPQAGAFPAGCRFHPRCPLAEARCRTESPELREIAPGQSVACHLVK